MEISVANIYYGKNINGQNKLYIIQLHYPVYAYRAHNTVMHLYAHMWVCVYVWVYVCVIVYFPFLVCIIKARCESVHTHTHPDHTYSFDGERSSHKIKQRECTPPINTHHQPITSAGGDVRAVDVATHEPVYNFHFIYIYNKIHPRIYFTQRIARVSISHTHARTHTRTHANASADFATAPSAPSQNASPSVLSSDTINTHSRTRRVRCPIRRTTVYRTVLPKPTVPSTPARVHVCTDFIAPSDGAPA